MDGSCGKQRRGSRRSVQFETFSFFSFVLVKGDPGTRAQRMLRAEGFFCLPFVVAEAEGRLLYWRLCMAGLRSTYPLGMIGPYQKRNQIDSVIPIGLCMTTMSALCITVHTKSKVHGRHWAYTKIAWYAK